MNFSRARRLSSSMVGKCLLAAWPKRDAGMRAQRLEQRGDRLGDRAVVAPNVERPQQIQCVSDLDGGRIEGRAVDHLHWIEAATLQSTLAVDILPERKEGPRRQVRKRGRAV